MDGWVKLALVGAKAGGLSWTACEDRWNRTEVGDLRLEEQNKNAILGVSKASSGQLSTQISKLGEKGPFGILAGAIWACGQLSSYGFGQ